MAEDKNLEQQEALEAVNLAESQETIPEAPQNSGDDDMEEPKTKDYVPREPSKPAPKIAQSQLPKVLIEILPALRDALDETIGNLGYNREIGSPEVHAQVWQVFEVLDKTKGKYLTEQQANEFINLIARAPYNVICGVMDEIKTNQGKFFRVLTPEEIQKLANPEASKK